MPFIIHMWLFDAKKPDILHTTNPRPRSAKSRCKKGDLRIDKKINVGLYTTVCNAMLDGYQTIVKLADDRFSEVIEQEYDVYCKLSNLQGTILPRCYGLYKNSEITCLILEHCGRPISSFASLTKMQRWVLIKCKIIYICDWHTYADLNCWVALLRFTEMVFTTMT